MRYDYQYEVAAIVVLLMLFVIYWSRKNLASKSNKIFLGLLINNLVVAITDFVSCFCISYPYDYPIGVCYAVSLLYMFSYNMMGVLFLLYIDSKTKVAKLWKKIEVLVFGVALLDFVLIFTSPWTHLIAYFDENRIYVHGPCLFLLYGISFVLLMLGVVCFMVSRKRFNGYQIFSSACLIFAMFACVAVQAIWERLLLGGFGCAVSLIFCYIAYENPAYYSFRDTQCLNRRAFLEVVKKRRLQNMDTCMLICWMQDYSYFSKSIGVNHFEMLTNRLAEYFYSQFGKDAFCIKENIYVVLLPSEEMGKSYEKRINNYLEKPIQVSDSEIHIKMRHHILQVSPDVNVMGVEELIQYVTEVDKDVLTINAKDILADKKHKQQVRRIVKLAIERDTFDVYYQPIRSIADGKFVSVEALIRLYDKELGFISPEEFIPLAEENNTIYEIGELVFNKVCRFIRNSGCMNLGVQYFEINLSPLQCFQKDLADCFERIMNKYEIDPTWINLELTETAHFSENDVMFNNIQYLSESGMSFSLDDYGSGFASQDYLFRLPVSIVKIDKGILWKAMDDEHAMVILASTMNMLKTLNKKVVVEGVENEEMVRVLEEMGCDYMQGYYYSKPLPEQEYLEFLKRNFATK